MRRVAVIGRGRLATAVARRLAIRGAEAVVLSRASGFDVTGPVSFAGHGALDAVVEATDVFTNDARRATAFFSASTKHLSAAATDAGIPMHLLVSIVNCQHPALAGNGYYAGKAAQERIAARAAAPVTILRSTLWFEFARQNLDRLGVGPLRLVPRMRVRPVALDAVAEVAAQRCLGERSFDRLDLCGPEVTTLWEMTRELPPPKGILVPVPAGRALRDGTLLPGPDAEVVGPRYSQWLRGGRR
jgi:nucleoside-diphosphate-sugar epimerase